MLLPIDARYLDVIDKDYLRRAESAFLAILYRRRRHLSKHPFEAGEAIVIEVRETIVLFGGSMAVKSAAKRRAVMRRQMFLPGNAYWIGSIANC